MKPDFEESLDGIRRRGGVVRRNAGVRTVFYPLWHTDTFREHTHAVDMWDEDFTTQHRENLVTLFGNLISCEPTCRFCLTEVFVGGNRGKDAKHLAVQVDVIHDVLDEIAHTAPNSNADTIFRTMMRTGDFSAGTLSVWADAVEDALGDEHWANAVRTTAANVRPALNSGPAVRLGND